MAAIGYARVSTTDQDLALQLEARGYAEYQEEVPA